MTMKRSLAAALTAALIAAAGCAVAQQPAEKKAPAKPAPEKKAPAGKALTDKPQYDAYEPSKRLRARRLACMNDEVSIDAWCAKKCRAGYQMEFSGKRVTCRSLTPLPPGVFPGPVRKQTGVQPALPPLKNPPPPRRSE